MRSLVIPFAALALVACAPPQGDDIQPGGGTWQSVSTVGAPTSRVGHTAVWSGDTMIVWGGLDPVDGTRHGDGGRYQPASDSWSSMSTAGAPRGNVGHTAVLANGDMIVWGGYAEEPSGYLAQASGGRYDIAGDAWTSTSTVGAPEPRSAHLAVWTGSEMIVWGGRNQAGESLMTGGRYDPAGDSWRPMSTAGAPMWSTGFTAVWTGSEMIVWGMTGPAQSLPFGARYNAADDAWQAMDEEGAPAISFHGAVWSGFEMVVWGSEVEGIGARYNPVPNTWSFTVRFDEAAGDVGWSTVWSGSELIAWGGYRQQGTSLTPLATGGRYHPLMDTWTPTATAGAPSPRADHTAVWTGTQMIVWGGSDDTGPTGTGGRYTP